MRFVVEHGEFFDFANDLAEVGLAVGGLADWLRAEGRKEIVAQVLILQRGLRHVANEDAVDVREKQITRVSQDTGIVLDVQGELEVVAPVAPVVAVVRQNRVLEEDTKTIEVRA